MDEVRPLGRKAYGSIPHLPGSRTGPSDRHLDPRRAEWLVTRAPSDATVIVQEKLDGSCVAIARLGERVLALGRAGDLAERSQNPARQQFARWVEREAARFRAVLADGERLVGEWLGLAHGTRYALAHEPLVAFDRMRGDRRALHDELAACARAAELPTPHLVHRGGALPVEDALARLGAGGHGALDPVEGVVYRLERGGEVIVVAKHVRSDKVDGHLLPENSGREAIWNWSEGSSPFHRIERSS